MIGIITYNAPHRKTLDLLGRLLVAGNNDIHLMIVERSYSKKHTPLFQHRPQGTYKYYLTLPKTVISYMTRNVIPDCDAFIIGGAGILPPYFIKGKKVINAHPGYLPNVRGLDALKWAIYEGQPIGVTTHVIDENPDEGFLIDRKIVPVYFNDTFHSIAQRVYETELEMLVEATDKPVTNISLKDDRYTPHRRMTHREELVMMERCNRLIKRSPWKS